MGRTQPANGKAVWARRDVFSSQCPKSVITERSLYFLEQFWTWKQFGGGTPWGLEAKTADAVLVLEKAWQMERQHGQQ